MASGCLGLMSFPRVPGRVGRGAAFKELVGAHGGLGGTQSFPFLLHPSDLEIPASELVGAEAVHRQLRRWLVQLCHGQYAEVV